MTLRINWVAIATSFTFFFSFYVEGTASRSITVPQRKENICMSAHPGCRMVVRSRVSPAVSPVSDLSFENQALWESPSGTSTEKSDSSSTSSDSVESCEESTSDALVSTATLAPLVLAEMPDQNGASMLFPIRASNIPSIQETPSIADSTANTPALVPEPAVAVSEKKENPTLDVTKKIVAVQQTKISPEPPFMRLRCAPTWTDDRVREETVWIYRYRWRQNLHKLKHTECKKMSSKPMATRSNRVQVLSSRPFNSEKESQLFEIWFWPYSTFLFRVDNSGHENEWTVERPKWFSEEICKKLFEYTLPRGREREEWPTYLFQEDLKESISLNFDVRDVEVKAYRVPAYKVFAAVGIDLFALRRK